MEKPTDGIDHAYLEKLSKFGSGTYYARYSTFWDRFFANLIDAAVLALCVDSLLAYLCFKISSLDFETLSELSMYAYFILCNAFFGRTVGKRLLSLKIIDASEEKEIGLWQAFRPDMIPLGLTVWFMVMYRNPGDADGGFGTVVQISSVIAVSWSLSELASAMLNEKRRAIHDFIAGTVVVKL